MDSPDTQKVMVVDDTPQNLTMLGDVLRSQGLRVLIFPNGTLAMKAAAENPPDLMLLDINMPDPDGYEVCRQMKADAALCRIPVVFLSIRDSSADKLKAFAVGGVDYITKPFYVAEILARVKAHLEISRLQNRLRMQNENLEKHVEEKTRQLAEAHERLQILDKAKDEFLLMISHEFRTPLTGILGVAELVLASAPRNQETLELRRLFEISRDRMLSLIENVMMLTQISASHERFVLTKKRFDELLRAALEDIQPQATERRISIEESIECNAEILCIGPLLLDALTALFKLAINFTQKHRSVHVICRSEKSRVVLVLKSEGRTFPREELEQFFEIGSSAHRFTEMEGMGFYPILAERIITLFKGTVKAKDAERRGICFEVSLPIAP